MTQYHRLENILGILLFIALFVLLLDFAISKGLYKICIIVIKVIVVLKLLILGGEYFKHGTRILPQGLHMVIAIPVLLILLDSIIANGISERYFIKNITSAIFIVFAVWMIPAEWENKISKLISYSLITLFLIASSSNYIALDVYSIPYGLFSNQHYLALQAIMVIPVTIFLFKSWNQFSIIPLIVILVMELYLLLESQSRTAWLALMAGSLVSLPFFNLKVRIWSAVLLTIIPFCIYYFGISGVDVRIDDLINNISNEERVAIWTDAITMQSDSDLYHWVLGHGLGGFEHDFVDYYSYQMPVAFTTPHNFIIEILYNSGVIGLMLVTIGELVFVYALFRLWWTTNFDSQKEIVVLIFMIFIIHFIHTFLTISFFSKQTIYFQAVFIGLGFYLFKREKLLTGNLHG